ncbi:MAG: hypothetical protein Q9221_003976 [Calogaya cf. arnoldii]
MANRYRQEGNTGRIDLKEDDPEMIDKLVNYLYNCDYDDHATVPTTQLTDGQQQALDSQHQHTPQTRRLGCNVDMYVIGDRCQLAGLKDLAKHKFSAALPACWNKENIIEVIRTIYDNTLPSDHGLRSCLVPLFQKHGQTLRWMDAFKELLKTYGEFAADFIEAWMSSDQHGPPKAFLQCTKCHKLYASDYKGHCVTIACSLNIAKHFKPALMAT